MVNLLADVTAANKDDDPAARVYSFIEIFWPAVGSYLIVWFLQGGGALPMFLWKHYPGIGLAEYTANSARSSVAFDCSAYQFSATCTHFTGIFACRRVTSAQVYVVSILSTHWSPLSELLTCLPEGCHGYAAPCLYLSLTTAVPLAPKWYYNGKQHKCTSAIDTRMLLILRICYANLGPSILQVA